MYVSDHTIYDQGTDREFDVVVYGTGGRPVVALPDWDFTCTSWENAGMVDALVDLVDGGRVQLFCPDTLDVSGWYARCVDADYRHENVVANLDFVERSLLPFVVETAASDEAPLLVGTGIGALNATILMLRHPERYGGLLALSGSYDARLLVDDLDEAWQALSPVDVASALPPRGKVLRLLRGLPIAFACGQGGGEAGVGSQRALDAVFAEKKVGATFEYWGYDVEPGWDWWREELRQLLPCLLEAGGLANRGFTRRVSVAQEAADSASEAYEQAEATLADLRGRLDAASMEVGTASERLEREQEAVANCVDEVERRTAAAREVWAEHDRVARLLAEARAKGDAAQASVDEAAGFLSVAEWICGEARAMAEAAKGAEAQLLAQVEEAEAAVSRAKVRAQGAADELAEVTSQVVKGRAVAKAEDRSRAAAKKPSSKIAPARKPPAASKRAPKGASGRQPVAVKPRRRSSSDSK